jgi:sarcosine reductase
MAARIPDSDERGPNNAPCELFRIAAAAMRLRLDIINIRDVRFAEKTALGGGVLSINRRELQALLQEDRRLSGVDVELAQPGDKCRILQVADVIEPRAKTGGSGNDFAGTLGGQGNVGEGSTCVLRGAAVVMSGGSAFLKEPIGGLIDMSGPAAEIGTYGKTRNIVVLPQPAAGLGLREYARALKVAGLRTAVYLARAGEGMKPDETEVYDLPPLTEAADGPRNLPKVAYVFAVLSTKHEPIIGEPVLYGSNIDRALPTVIHPNEVLDGAVISPYRAPGMETYVIQNHPVIRELYRRHGKDLWFTGVIITTAPDSEYEYERAATVVANTAKRIFGADGVVLNKAGMGAEEIVPARMAERCEELGMKTAYAMFLHGADQSDASLGADTLFNMRGVDAIVNMGTTYMKHKLPAVDRVIGDSMLLPGGIPISGNIEVTVSAIKGALSQLGYSRITAVRQ